jgi:hydrogenase maturation protease
MERVAVLGMGNVLMGDDGAGPYATAVLAAHYRLPENVSVQDIGTPGLDLTPYLANTAIVVLIDTVHSNAPPASIRTYDKQALMAQPLQPRLSPHDPALGQCLTILEMAGCAPRDVLLVGIVPSRSALGAGLSNPVRDVIPAVVARVVEELRSRGIRVEAAAPPDAPDIWWEEGWSLAPSK